MMTNSAGMVRTLITYGLCILFAVVMGYILTDVGLQPTYQNLFVLVAPNTKRFALLA